ncbi:MAG TPA: hypothetical protein DCL54_04090 [Alphaproteobacteria bacterium]|jgi:hypothetical protein|nr:hypothetical protein [Alphaproteobacteria bacterium]
MLHLILKAALSGVLVLAISEAARRWPGLGGLVASLPLVSILAIIWLWRDTGGDASLIARHARATLWYVIPSLPFFLILPALLDRGTNFWLSLSAASALTICLYLLAVWLAGRFGLSFG